MNEIIGSPYMRTLKLFEHELKFSDYWYSNSSAAKGLSSMALLLDKQNCLRKNLLLESPMF